MAFKITPWQFKDAIDQLGGDPAVITVPDMLTAIEAYIETITTDLCKQCAGDSYILVNQEDIPNPVKVKCPTCGGYGRTTQPVTSVVTYSQPPIPNIND